MSCFLLAACEPQKIVEPLPTPPERLVCEAAGIRPDIPAEEPIDWGAIRTVEEARDAYARFLATVRTREGIIAGYVLQLEGKLFVCFNNMEWRRQWEAELVSD